MPKVTLSKYSTPVKVDQNMRTVKIIMAAAGAAGYKTLVDLANAAGMSYQMLQRRMTGQAKFSLEDIAVLACVLSLNPCDYAALCGASTLSRYECDYQV